MQGFLNFVLMSCNQNKLWNELVEFRKIHALSLVYLHELDFVVSFVAYVERKPIRRNQNIRTWFKKEKYLSRLKQHDIPFIFSDVLVCILSRDERPLYSELGENPKHWIQARNILIQRPRNHGWGLDDEDWRQCIMEWLIVIMEVSN